MNTLLITGAVVIWAASVYVAYRLGQDTRNVASGSLETPDEDPRSESWEALPDRMKEHDNASIE